MSAWSASENRPWRIAKLGDVCEKITDGTHHSPPNGQIGDFKYVTAKNIKPTGLDLTDISYVDGATHREIYSRCDVRKDDILYVKDGATTGRVALNTLEEEFSLLSSVGVLRPNRKHVLPKYLLYALQVPTVKDRMLADVAGVAITRLTLKKLKAAEISLAPLDQQGSIVAEIEKQFSRLDEAVANLNRVKANLNRQRSSILQAVTSGGLAAEGRAAPPSEEWRWLTIDELASPAPRSIQSGPFGSTLRHSEFQASGRLVIGIDNVRDGEFSIGSNHRISDAKFHELEKYAARPGDVLITVMATIGRVCLVPRDIEPAIITKHVYRITVNRELAIPDYVAIALRGSREVRAQLMESVRGQTRPGLNGGLIKKIRVPLPTLVYQRSIVAEVDRRLSIVREVEAEVDANLKRAQVLRQAVLQRAFSTGAPSGEGEQPRVRRAASPVA